MCTYDQVSGTIKMQPLKHLTFLSYHLPVCSKIIGSSEGSNNSHMKYLPRANVHLYLSANAVNSTKASSLVLQ